MELIKDLRAKEKEIDGLKSLLVECSEDKDMRGMITEEMSEALDEEKKLQYFLLKALLPKDDADERDCILEVRAGTGGEEASLFAMDVFKMYEKFSQKKGWNFDAVEIMASDLKGYKEASAAISGAGAFGQLKFESGVHRVQRVPVTEKSGRVHTSAVSVAVLPQANEKPETCLDLMFSSKSEAKIKFLDIYAVEFTEWGQIHGLIPNVGPPLAFCQTEMYRFVVHGFQRSRRNRSTWVLVSYTFGHKHLQTCQTWFEQINSHIFMEADRPKNLWVFVHPLSGNGNGCRTWQTVAPIFSRAKVKTKVTVTERAGHAYDLVASSTEKELRSFDGIVTVGGDGFFNEILNGLLLSRHKAPYPLVPVEFMHSVESNSECDQSRLHDENKIGVSIHDLNGNSPGISYKNEEDPLLSTPESSVPGLSNFRKEAGACKTDQDFTSFFPNEWFRLGIIPAGSTDAIVISTTGARDPVTSALHIILGKRVCVDIAQIVRWEGGVLSSMRYAASFAGYGFYGDVIKESEKYRWMGPKRYDYAGTRVFLEHRSYEAEVTFLEDKSSNSVAGTSCLKNGMQQVDILGDKPKEICCIDCRICKETTSPTHLSTSDDSDLRWLRSKGHFLSVGAAVISCRNGRAPDGLVADAHLADGFLHLILIKECPRPFYLWHLTRLTRKGSNPLDFPFVEHHKTQAFTFISSGDKESVWNVDGELFQARKLSAQVFQGLVSLFAPGPED